MLSRVGSMIGHTLGSGHVKLSKFDLMSSQA